MKRYQFRLEQVLRIRRVQEDQAAAALGAARRAEADTAAAVRSRLATMAARPQPAGAAEPSALLAARLIWDAESVTLREEQAAAREAAAQVDVARVEWTHAAQRVEALEVLDLRRREEHRTEVDRDEAARVDDLVASRHHLTRPGDRS